ncbi:RNA-directed DNA polymerase, eukaryota [Tanacetum coccineum]
MGVHSIPPVPLTDEQSIKYPPGFTPDAENREFNLCEENVRSTNVENLQQGNDVEILDEQKDIHDVKGSNTQDSVSACSGKFKRSAAPETGGSILCLLEELVKDSRDKHMLWDYLTHVSSQWDGEVVMMGDFNEVRFKSDRFGSVFNVRGADVFNSFIANAGLVEVPLGGSAFTWSHKSATKMSKIERNTPGDKSNAMRNLMYKLKFLKVRIRGWLSTNRNSTKAEITRLIGELAKLDEVIDNGNAMDDTVPRRLEVLNSIQNLNQIQATEAAQKAKIKWSVEGNENVQFFHGMINKKRSQQNIWDVMIDGKWIEEPSRVKKQFFQHFRDRFDEPKDDRVRIDMCFPRSLSNEQKDYLERMVSMEEVKRAIPKIPDANMVKDFRPISLIGSIYKIVAKILANRIVRVLDDIVNEVQSAFIAETQILDGPFILNEVMHWCKTKKKQALFFKVDFEKAYDTVRWDFLNDVLHKFGFGNRWRLWIQSCLRSSRGSIIVNGSPTEEFQFFKGLKQGDPLSPFLFILIMESLHLSFQRVVDAGMYTGIKLFSSLNLSHLFYADDVMFVGQWCDSNINTLVHALECFHRALGLKINMSKSTKVGGSMSRVHTWDEVVEKVTSRLSRWKMKSLSISGRLTLLKSVLGSMPIFHMSIFKVPSSVLQRLESIRSRFFKGHDLGSNKAAWVKWSNVLMPKEKRGLGVSSLYALNRGLLFKWVWKFYAQKTSLWARVIKAIHGVDGKVGKAINSGASSCWTSIVREVEVLKQQGVNFFEYLQLNMGNGESTTFWEDRWLEGSVLKDIFPRLYVLETNKKVSVGDKLKDFRLDSSFRRKARGGIEQVQYEELSDMVNSISLTPKNDRYVWSLSNSGDFSVASFRKVIDENRYPGGRSRTRWVKYVPIKVNVTAWKIKMDALPTRLNISRRGMDIQSLSCPICDCGVESSRMVNLVDLAAAYG